MHLLLTEHISGAIHSLKTTKTRTLLTTLGVAIGVASVTAILALSGGITRVIENQVHALDGNITIVRPSTPSASSGNLASPTATQTYATSTLTEDDLEAIRTISDVEAAAPLMIVNGSLKSGETTVKDGTILATTPELESIASLPIRDGQFIDSVTNSYTAVVGNQLAIDLFGTDQPIGQTFKVRGQTFTVIGVLKPMNDPINYNNVDFDRTVLISLESGKSFNRGIAQIQQINVRAKSTEALHGVIQQINDRLTKNHSGETDFSVLSGDDIAKPTSQFFLALTTVMTAIAAISLVVGGIGIMNIMLVGVAERTREIGLRKAVGASNTHIVWQFLIESLIISLVGGVFGYIGGYAIAFIISSFLTFTPAFSWQVALAAFSIAVGVGVIFGLYPALKAARKDPIESLRLYR